MSTARKYAFNNRRTFAPQARKGMIASFQIEWKNLRKDLHGDNEALREERLIWINDKLNLKRPVKSLTELTDGQLAYVLDDLRTLTGTKVNLSGREKGQIEREHLNADKRINFTGGADVIHLASEEQQFTARKLFEFLGWNIERIEEFLRDRFNCPNVAMLRFEKANSLLMILLNIAAHADLKSKGRPTGRAATSKHIKFIKTRLNIGD